MSKSSTKESLRGNSFMLPIAHLEHLRILNSQDGFPAATKQTTYCLYNGASQPLSAASTSIDGASPKSTEGASQPVSRITSTDGSRASQSCSSNEDTDLTSDVLNSALLHGQARGEKQCIFSVLMILAGFLLGFAILMLFQNLHLY